MSAKDRIDPYHLESRWAQLPLVLVCHRPLTIRDQSWEWLYGHSTFTATVYYICIGDLQLDDLSSILPSSCRYCLVIRLGIPLVGGDFHPETWGKWSNLTWEWVETTNWVMLVEPSFFWLFFCVDFIFLSSSWFSQPLVIPKLFEESGTRKHMGFSRWFHGDV